MPRKIDQIPEPNTKRQMKVIVASPSRSGTLGLYRAMQILGFSTYHMYECCAINGLPHMKILGEAVVAQHNRLSGIKRFNRADFDKWFANYDCLVEIPSYMGIEAIEAYAEDPNVKFILTERTPDDWVASVNNTVAGVVRMANSFPFTILRYFDSSLYYFLHLNQVMYWVLSDRTNPDDPDNEFALRRNYVEYIKMVKKSIPADRMCVIKLEDGLDWDKICPFLGVPVPEEEYPGRNEPEKFQALLQRFLQPRVISAAVRLASVTIPAVGVLAWGSVKYAPSVSAVIMGRS